MVIQLEDCIMKCVPSPNGGALIFGDKASEIKILIGVEREAALQWAKEVMSVMSGIEIVGPESIPGSR